MIIYQRVLKLTSLLLVKNGRIARENRHVERAIEKIKNFRFLQQVIPLSMAADVNKINLDPAFNSFNLFRRKYNQWVR